MLSNILVALSLLCSLPRGGGRVDPEVSVRWLLAWSVGGSGGRGEEGTKGESVISAPLFASGRLPAAAECVARFLPAGRSVARLLPLTLAPGLERLPFLVSSSSLGLVEASCSCWSLGCLTGPSDRSVPVRPVPDFTFSVLNIQSKFCFPDWTPTDTYVPVTPVVTVV